MNRTVIHRRRSRARHRSRARRYTIGPASYIERLKVAAVGDHVCIPFRMSWFLNPPINQPFRIVVTDV